MSHIFCFKYYPQNIQNLSVTIILRVSMVTFVLCHFSWIFPISSKKAYLYSQSYETQSTVFPYM